MAKRFSEVLRGTQCTVRPWRTSDAGSVVAYANNIKIARQLRDRFPHPYTLENARNFLASVSGRDSDGSNLAIEVDGEAIGAVGFVAGEDIERYSAEIGYWLGEPFWGRGIATEAVMLVTADLFVRVNMLRLFALPFADNAASARVLEKAGYLREALLRSSSVKYGVARDQFLYARVNDRWRQPQPAENQRAS